MKKIIANLAVVLAAVVLFTACCSNCDKKTECAMSTPETVKMVIVASKTLKTEKVSDFLNEVPALIAASRAEPGCISYTLYQDPTDSTKFMFFEEWKDQAAIDFHFNTDHFKNIGGALAEYDAAPTVIKVMTVSSEK